jgi:hypothetical protein
MTAPGVYTLTDEEYFGPALASTTLSSTGARKLLEPGGPARYRHQLDTGTVEVRREFDLGHAVHTMVLGSGPEPVVVIGTGKGGPNAWQNQADKDLVAQARTAGRVPLRPCDMAAAVGDDRRREGAPDRGEAAAVRRAREDADLAGRGPPA